MGGECRAGRVRKTSRRDLPYVLAKGLTGETTVSATMLLAARAGIHIFVTGGAASCPLHLSRTCILSSRQPDTALTRSASCIVHLLLSAEGAACCAGIGGVHRGGESTMDVSADLTELGRTPVTVVCAGAKSILDIPRTLEYLETQVTSVSYFCLHKALCASLLRMRS